MLLQLTPVLVDVAVRSANRIRSVIFLLAGLAFAFILQVGARSDVSHLYAASKQEKKRERSEILTTIHGEHRKPFVELTSR